MTRTIVTYKVRPREAAYNEELIRNVFDELRDLDPPNLSYEAFLLDDGRTFVHIVEYEGENPVPKLESFKRYSVGVRDRCEWSPVACEPQVIGSIKNLASV